MINWLSQHFNKAKIIGIDKSEDQLFLGKNNFSNNKNISFINIDVLDTENTPLIKKNLSDTARYLLLHLPYEKWDNFFTHILHMLKPGSSLILEEPRLPATAYPTVKALSTGAELSKKFAEQLGIKLDCIEPLWDYTKNINKTFKVNDVQFNQPILTSERSKSLLSQSFDQIVPALIKSNISTEQEIKQISDDVNNLVKDPNYIATSFRVIQLHLVKI